MESFAWTYWWLIFPIMWFVFGLFGMWAHHRRQQSALDLMKTYAEQGRDPSEIAKLLNADPDGYGPYGYWGRRRWRYGYWAYGPFWAWRKAIMAGCVAIGFWIAANYLDTPFDGPFTIVAVIMSVIAAGALLMAIVSSFAGMGRSKQI